jgi:cytoskeleton protein RodZ
MTNFGASFKQARESKGISLAQIAAETRISTRFLRAIENEEFQLLPGGIFNRGFVRAFAEKVGLDPDQAVADYERMAEVRQPEVPVATQSAPPVPGKKQRRLYPIAVGVLALVIVIFYVVTRESGHIAQTASAPATPPVIATQPAAPPTAAPVPSVAPPDNVPETTAAVPESQSKQTPNPAPAPTPPAPTPAPQASAPAPSAPSAQNALSLEIDAQDPSWIKVVADGKSANPGEVLKPGMTRKYTAHNKFKVSVGNAGGLSLKLNDKPMKPMGKIGQVREITITPDTAKDFIAQ